MENSLLIYIGIAFLVSLVTQFLVIDFSHKKGIFIDDHESELPQKLHTTPTPRIGGFGFFLGIMTLIVDLEIGRWLLICTIPAFISGFLEDLYSSITPKQRLLIMSFSTFLVLYLMKAYVTDFGFFQVPAPVGIIITIIAILGLINGINLVDGFNGLASGISLIILATLTATAHKIGDTSMPLVCAIIFASLAGFYVFNYPKGKIFLGDGGAYTIGFLLAVLSILIVKNSNGKVDPFFALLTLVYPVWEVIFSFSRRLAKGKSPLQPDSEHYHQFVFKTIGKENNPITTLLVYPLVVILGFVAYTYCNNTLVLAASVGIFVVVYLISYYALKSLINKQAVNNETKR
jgi:UDP-N-acetylmuramyl pentapeptide phosphotransferase/UDP-N-acetylglucosamine-1-phosphate transferase